MVTITEYYDLTRRCVLTHGFSIIVSRPGFGACRDDMRFYVRDLVTRMMIRDIEMKREALTNLHVAMVEDEMLTSLLTGRVVFRQKISEI